MASIPDEEEDGYGDIGTSRYPIMPSFQSLQQMRNRLHTAFLGKRLMKWKEVASVREVRYFAENVEKLQQNIFTELQPDAMIALARCRYFSYNFNENILEGLPAQAHKTTTSSQKSLAGSKLTEFDVESSDDPPFKLIGLGCGGEQIKTATKMWSEILSRLVYLAELRTTFKVFLHSYVDANKKKHAMQKVVIPKTIATIMYISRELEEIEREDLYRIKKLKMKKQNKEKGIVIKEKEEEERNKAEKIVKIVTKGYGDTFESSEKKDKIKDINKEEKHAEILPALNRNVICYRGDVIQLNTPFNKKFNTNFDSSEHGQASSDAATSAPRYLRPSKDSNLHQYTPHPSGFCARCCYICSPVHYATYCQQEIDEEQIEQELATVNVEEAESKDNVSLKKDETKKPTNTEKKIESRPQIDNKFDVAGSSGYSSQCNKSRPCPHTLPLVNDYKKKEESLEEKIAKYKTDYQSHEDAQYCHNTQCPYCQRKSTTSSNAPVIVNQHNIEQPQHNSFPGTPTGEAGVFYKNYWPQQITPNSNDSSVRDSGQWNYGNNQFYQHEGYCHYASTHDNPYQLTHAYGSSSNLNPSYNCSTPDSLNNISTTCEHTCEQSCEHWRCNPQPNNDSSSEEFRTPENSISALTSSSTSNSTVEEYSPAPLPNYYYRGKDVQESFECRAESISSMTLVRPMQMPCNYTFYNRYLYCPQDQPILNAKEPCCHQRQEIYINENSDALDAKFHSENNRRVIVSKSSETKHEDDISSKFPCDAKSDTTKEYVYCITDSKIKLRPSEHFYHNSEIDPRTKSGSLNKNVTDFKYELIKPQPPRRKSPCLKHYHTDQHRTESPRTRNDNAPKVKKKQRFDPIVTQASFEEQVGSEVLNEECSYKVSAECPHKTRLREILKLLNPTPKCIHEKCISHMRKYLQSWVCKSEPESADSTAHESSEENVLCTNHRKSQTNEATPAEKHEKNLHDCQPLSTHGNNSKKQEDSTLMHDDNYKLDSSTTAQGDHYVTTKLSNYSIPDTTNDMRDRFSNDSDNYASRRLMKNELSNVNLELNDRYSESDEYSDNSFCDLKGTDTEEDIVKRVSFAVNNDSRLQSSCSLTGSMRSVLYDVDSNTLFNSEMHIQLRKLMHSYVNTEDKLIHIPSLLRDKNR